MGTPLLVMLGTLDDSGTSDAMRHLARTVPGARLEELEAAHMINLEHPDRFNALLREFLAAH
jgi:3-oxoadipate enol-lactonase